MSREAEVSSHKLMKLKILVDMDDTIANYSEAFSRARRAVPGIQYPQSQVDFFRNLDPIAGAVRCVEELIEEGHDVWFLTAPSVYNPLSYMEKRIWIEKHFGLNMAHKMIIAYNKSMIEGDVLIDDGTVHGQCEFRGIWLRYGSSSYGSWDELVREVRAISVEGVERSSSHAKRAHDTKRRFACCPFCGASVEFWSAFPFTACESCAERATDENGRSVDYYNTHISGGLEGRYSDTNEVYSADYCFIDGTECVAVDTRLGGPAICVCVGKHA
ncbi:5' nucleotidase, NT5C type [Umboniibacter marinipuniceus]|uniref:Deoxypyrimidine-specific 5' nucleotidase type C protein (NT5C) n=1 Tax=Umboniibacter marinipuniceus TaxID=569599 RepID=A0A3M0ADW9_9GAMM|nr:hypothetical protein [Umboniibacter marinipuniceus]RMA82697.1 deoxypyrimidine-specific 5' nucleotidase type C protein (NT5C) [Umboniibacter marinipuniceus]